MSEFYYSAFDTTHDNENDVNNKRNEFDSEGIYEEQNVR